MNTQTVLEFIQQSDGSELSELSRSVRKFAEQNLSISSAESLLFKRSDFEAMSQLGLTSMSISEKFGGTELSPLAIATSIFEISRIQMAPAIYLSVHNMVSGLIQKWSSDPFHEKTLEKLASGEALGAFCLTEADAGSDAAALKTKATKTTDGYLLSGEKIYITSAGVADIYLVFARTSAEPTKGISAFLVSRDNPGLTFGSPEKKMGAEGSPIASVHLNNCQVPVAARLNDEGKGYKIALSGLSGGRVNISAAACGIAAQAIQIAADHLRSRKQFGKSLQEFQGLQFILADLIIKLRASILLTRDAADRLNDQIPKNTPASIAKCFATDSAMQITTDCVQLLGGAGYLFDYGVERIMRDAKMLQIVEGTNQIQRLVIAKEFLAD